MEILIDYLMCPAYMMTNYGRVAMTDSLGLIIQGEFLKKIQTGSGSSPPGSVVQMDIL